jgi:hypothetical protein
LNFVKNYIIIMKQIDGKEEILTETENSLSEQFDDIGDTSDLPTSLIITNIDNRVFSASDIRDYFEETFKKFESSATFQYFKSFRRVRVNYSTPLSAAQARIQCHQMRMGDQIINCYFAGPTLSSNKDPNDIHLHPPPLEKQFLISPPASPPVGWKPVDEAKPGVMNVELLSALASLTPGAAHELHPQSESQPGIVVHICEEDDIGDDKGWKPKLRIAQTARPGATIHRSYSEGSEDSLCTTPP